MRIGLLKRWLKGLPEVQASIAAERGEFSLFALIEREEWDEGIDNLPRWCLYVAAPWIWEEGYAAEKYMQEQVRPYEDRSGYFAPPLYVEVVKPTSPHLEEVWEYCSTDNGMVEIHDVEILDVTAKRGYIFTSRRPDNFDVIRLEAQLEADRQRQRYDQSTKEQLARMKTGLRGQGNP